MKKINKINILVLIIMLLSVSVCLADVMVPLPDYPNIEIKPFIPTIYPHNISYKLKDLINSTMVSYTVKSSINFILIGINIITFCILPIIMFIQKINKNGEMLNKCRKIFENFIYIDLLIILAISILLFLTEISFFALFPIIPIVISLYYRLIVKHKKISYAWLLAGYVLVNLLFVILVSYI